MRSLFLTISLLLGLVSCHTAREGNTTVGGNIGRASGQMLKLEDLSPVNSLTFDSVIIGEPGNFDFRFNAKEPGLYLLGFSGKNRLLLELRPGDTVRVKAADGSNLEDAVITGSPASSDMKKFFGLTAGNRRIYDSLQGSLLSHQDDPGFAELSRNLDESLKPIWENQRALETSYVDSHLNSLTSLLVLNQGIGTSPVLTFQNDSVYFMKIDSSLSKSFPGNKHVVFHHNRVLRERELEAMKKQTR
ncbi:MAG: DUF4369 domain-containing protein [Bacteroidota bacterium]|jgi:Domain of unknown function (DUF4369)